MDAYQSYKAGDNTSAIVGAGLEVLPYGIGKAVNKTKNIINSIPNNTSNSIGGQVSEQIREINENF